MTARPVIALLSDFGLRDHYVAAMKAVILGICPDATLFDISHEIPPQDILSGALELEAIVPYLPAGTVVLCDDTVVFGRGPEADAVLEGDEFASGRHARVFRRGDDVYLEDLGSTNGTFVNGQRLAAERRLRAGDIVVVGSTEMTYRSGGGGG